MNCVTVCVTILLGAFLFSCSPRPYVEGGLMFHSQELAEPEVHFSSCSLGYAEAGIEQRGWSLFFRHLSDPSNLQEGGYGINSLGLSKRVYLAAP